MAKRIFILFCILFCAGCAQHTEDQLMIWHSFRPEGREVLQQHLALFKAKLIAEDSAKFAHWRFDERFYAPEEARTNFIISSMAGKGPALFRGASDNIGPLVELAVIQPLENLLEPSFLDSFIVDPVPAAVWYRGHLFQLADEIGNHLCLVYNKRFVPEPPQTIEDLIHLGRQLLDNPAYPDLKYALAWNYTEPYFAVPFVGGYGGWLLNEKNEPTLNSEAVIKASQLIYDLGHKYKIIPEECDYEISNALFSDGYAAMIINGPWSWSSYLDRDIDIGITRIPLINETGRWPSPIVSPLGYSLNVNLTGEARQMAIKLLKYLTTPAVELEFTRRLGSIPTRKEAWRDSVVTSDWMIQSSIYQLQVGVPMPVVTELRWIWDAMRPSYQAIFTGEISPAEAARQMQKSALKLIKENRE